MINALLNKQQMQTVLFCVRLTLVYYCWNVTMGEHFFSRVIFFLYVKLKTVI